MSEKSNIWYFEQVDLYEILCPHKIGGMVDTLHFDHYDKDEFIYFPDQPSRNIYMVS